MEGPVSPVLHVYVVAPLAVNVAVPPGQIVAEFTDTFKAGFIVTEVTAVFEHPEPVDPVTV